MSLKKMFLIIFSLALFATACGIAPPSALPTTIPTAAFPILPTATPTSRPLPPTTTPVSPPDTPTPLPPTPTAGPTSTPLPVDPVVNILEPVDQSQIIVGQTTNVRGLAKFYDTQSVWVSLFTGDGRLLLDQQAEVTSQSNSNTGTWTVDINVPLNVIGISSLVATVRNESNQVLAQINYAVNLAVNTDIAERYVILDEPVVGTNVIAGHYMVVQGYSKSPSGNFINIDVYGGENCQELISDIGFAVGGTGSWFGYPNLPNDYQGKACLIVYAGNRGEPNWREAQVPLNVLAKDDPAASGITYIRPNSELFVKSGDTINTFGIAYNAVDRKVKVSIFLENGELVAQIEDIPTDRLGYWETEIAVPAGIEGPAILDVITGEAGDFGHAQTTQLIFIEPTDDTEP